MSVKIIRESLSLLETQTVELFLGMLKLKGLPFLVFAEQAKQIAKIQNHSVYEITKLNWASVSANIKLQQLQSVDQLIEQISQLIQKGGFYYCQGYNLTSSKQYSCNSNDVQEKFMWNHHLVQPLMEQNIGSFWMTPVIQGYVASTHQKLGKEGTIQYILISRRSSKRAGTRFYSRGVDDLGCVSNFVESQQLLYFHNLVISHVQIRGSVPVFWEQLGIDGLASKLQISRSIELTESAFLAHFAKLKKTFKRFLCVNLLSLKKESQTQLTEFFEKCIQRYQPQIGSFVKYEYFDFADQCKKQKYQNSNQLIDKLKQINEAFRFYCYDLNTDSVISTQQGVIRTNCLDCLDRTNFIQTKVALQIVQSVIKMLGFRVPRPLHEDMDSQYSYQMVGKLKSIWADNGDMISRHYTGIDSTHTDVIRTGKRTLMGVINHKWKSLNRFYKQFTDRKKQQAINLLLGYDIHQGQHQQNLNRQLKQRQRQFSSYSQATFYIVTWNVNQKQPGAYAQSMFNLGTQSPTFIIVGLEQVEAKQNLIGHFLQGKSVKEAWVKVIDEHLCGERGYTQVSMKSGGGCLLLVYFKSLNRNLQLAHISDISHCKMSFNLLNSDRTVLMTKMKIFDTSVLFGNMYFSKASDLLEKSQQIHEKAFQQFSLGRQKNEKISKSDYKFLFGFVGDGLQATSQHIYEQLDKYRKLRLSREESASMHILSELAELDILNKERHKDSYLENYSEGPLVFLPTSTIDIDRTYSQTQKPSWSQRIFVHNDQNSIVKQQFYKSLEIFDTMHLPVASMYAIDLKSQDNRKLQSVKNKLINGLQSAT